MVSKQLYLIDGFAQIFRAYYAIRGGMQSPVTGEPTHAVFGFAGMLIKLLSQLKPDYVVVAIDGPGKTFRDELYADYKATRDETPKDLTAQIPRVLELIEAFGIPAISHPGLEADDVIATITQRVLDDPECADVRIRIVSRDKDLEQLLCDRVTMYDIHKDEEVDVEGLKESKGITPEQVVDVLALMGDTVDNVPGVPGIGPKTAASLVQEFGSIEGIFANLDRIKGKRRENLEAAKDQLPLSRTLVTLKRDGDFPFSLEDARVKGINLNRLIHLFQQLGFRRYQHEVRNLALELGLVGEESAAALQIDEAVEGALAVAVNEGGAPAAQAAGGTLTSGAPGAVMDREGQHERGEYETVTTAARLDEIVRTLKEQEIIAVDTETTGLAPDAELCGISLAWRHGHGVYVPTRSPDQASHLDTEGVLRALKDVLEDPSIKKCGHNIKFDARILGNAGVWLRGVVFDSMLASILLDPGRPGHKLEQLALRPPRLPDGADHRAHRSGVGRRLHLDGRRAPREDRRVRGGGCGHLSPPLSRAFTQAASPRNGGAPQEG